MEPRHLFLIASLAVCAASPRASMIALYTVPGDTVGIEDAADVAQAVRVGGSVPARYSARFSDSAVLTPEFSVPEGASAYFWSDETYRHAGFEMRGAHVRFDGGPQAADTALGKHTIDIAPAIVWSTNLGQVSVNARELRIGYSLAKGGRVSAEAFGLNGRVLGGWSWEDAAAGARERVFTLARAPEGPMWVRWTFGDVQVLRAVPRASGAGTRAPAR